MLQQLLGLVPPEAAKLALVLFLSFLIGLEREELKKGGRRTFGGVRTFPIIGLLGYVLAFIAHGQVLAMTLGFAIVAGFLFLSYWHKLRYSVEAGMTTELSGLVVYLSAELIYLNYLWLAAAIIVVCLLLLELKTTLEGLSQRLAPEETFVFTKFLLLTAVILPIVPNQDFSPFHLNPFKTWLVVLAVSGISYGSYLLQRLSKGASGTLLTGILGGVYSSTATTVALAKRAASGRDAHHYAGAILAASGVMYLRIEILVWLFNRDLGQALAPWFISFALAALLGGWAWSRREAPETADLNEVQPAHNPLELKAAFFFAALFLVMIVVTHLATAHLGKGGIFSLAALMGVADVDPFIMGLTQGVGAATTLHLAAVGIVVCTASNNLVKGGYAWFFARSAPAAAKWSFLLMAGLALLGMVPLGWL